MASEWWLIDEPTQNALAGLIDAAAAAVVANFNNHWNENSLTAALGQELLRTRVEIGDTSARFSYRNFSEQNEEPVTGADGGIIVTIRSRQDVIKKAVLFQAKRFAQERPVTGLSLPRAEAKRLRGQIDTMIPITEDCIVLAHTRERIYAIDGRCADRLSIDDMRYLTANCRLVSLGTFLGKWVARCSRGDAGPFVVSNIEEPQGFVRHRIGMEVDTDQPPSLSPGNTVSDPLRFSTPRSRLQRDSSR